MGVCSKRGCEEIAVIRQGRQDLCPMHYRFGQMRAKAKADKKLVPSIEALSLLAPSGWDMRCPDCQVIMNWRQRDGAATVVSLQHYRSGEMALVCLSCNSRHASMDGDSFRDMDSENKQCPKCLACKPRVDFYLDSSRSGLLKSKSLCKVCSDSGTSEWRSKSRDSYNAYQRAWRAKKKLEKAKARGESA